MLWEKNINTPNDKNMLILKTTMRKKDYKCILQIVCSKCVCCGTTRLPRMLVVVIIFYHHIIMGLLFIWKWWWWWWFWIIHHHNTFIIILKKFVWHQHDLTALQNTHTFTHIRSERAIEMKEKKNSPRTAKIYNQFQSHVLPSLIDMCLIAKLHVVDWL